MSIRVIYDHGRALTRQDAEKKRLLQAVQTAALVQAALFKEDHEGVLMLSTDRGKQFLTCWEKCGRGDGAARVQDGDVKGAALKWLADRRRILADTGNG